MLSMIIQRPQQQPRYPPLSDTQKHTETPSPSPYSSTAPSSLRCLRALSHMSTLRLSLHLQLVLLHGLVFDLDRWPGALIRPIVPDPADGALGGW